MKQYVGRFPVNMGLTKKLGYEDFQIYRDPEYGLYAYSKSHDVECSYWSELITDAIMARKPSDDKWDGRIYIR